MQSYTLKPRFNRSNPAVVRKVLHDTRSHGRLANTKPAAKWKPISQRTLGELAAMGKLTLQNVQNAINSGLLNPKAFRKAFWAALDTNNLHREQLEIINRFAFVLF